MHDFLETDVRDTMDALLAPLKHKFQYYSVPRHFKQVEVEWEVGDFANRYFW